MAVSGSGQIVIVKRDGTKGSSYPLITGCLSIGSAKDCNIRVTTKGFPQKQCIITVNKSEAYIENLSTETPTILNDKVVQTKVLSDGDIISFNNSKFKWEYTTKSSSIISRKSGILNRTSHSVKRTRKSFNRRKSAPYIGRPEAQVKNTFESKTRNSLCNLQGSVVKTRQVAVVMPQRRTPILPDKNNMPAERQRNRTKSENIICIGRSKSKLHNNNTYHKNAGILASGSKFRRSNKVEKLEDPVIIDKNKKAVLMLLSRSPNNKNIFKPSVNLTPKCTPTPKVVEKIINVTPAISKSTGKLNVSSAKSLVKVGLNQNGVSSENKLTQRNRLSRIPVKAVRRSIANKTKSIISTPVTLSKVKNSDAKNVSFNLKLDYSNIDTLPEDPEPSNSKFRSRASKVASPGRYAILSGKKVRNTSLNSTIVSRANASKSLFDISGVEALCDSGSFSSVSNLSKTRSGKSPDGKKDNVSVKHESVNNTDKSISGLTSPEAYSNVSRRSQNLTNGKSSSTKKLSPIGTPAANASFAQNLSEDNIEPYFPLITSTLKKKESPRKSSFTPNNVASNKSSPKTPYTRLSDANITNGSNSAVKSFISTLTNALNVVNNSGTDLKSVVNTPEYKALSNQIISIGKFVDISTIESPSPVILEIGKTNNSTRATRSSLATPNDSNQKKYQRNTVTPQNLIHSPIISPKHLSALTPESPDMSYDSTDIKNTPNLSKVFEVEASTPMDYRKSSVIDKINHFEAKSLESSINNSKRSNRKSSIVVSDALGNKKLQYESRIKGTLTEPRKKNAGISKNINRNSLPLNKRKCNNSSREHASDDSNVTDVNAPGTENEIVITPKSTLKPMPEVVKEKHSTAKKSVSRKVLIDHLTQSPDIAKELFKSPVKRKLTRSMQQYNSSKMFEDAQDINLINAAHDASFNLLTKSAEQSTAFSDIENTSSIILAYESFDEETNVSNSPKNKLKSLNATRISTRNNSQISRASMSPKTPANSSINISGLKKSVKRLSQTPKSVKRSPNDLTTNGRKSPRQHRSVVLSLKPQRVTKSPKNVSGVIQLNKSEVGRALRITSKSPRSPVNDLSDVKGVVTAAKFYKSPNNDLTDVKGVKKLLKTPRILRSPKNDLTNVAGVKKLLKTPRKLRSPKNDLTNVAGVKKLLKTPRKLRSPKNDLTNVAGVKKLLKTPKKLRSPKNDLTNVAGVKKLLKTPKELRSPKNDLTNVAGVKKLLKTPKELRSPKNDLTNVAGVKKLLKTPRELRSPKNDLTNVAGVKKLLKTPRKLRSPKNDLMNVSGVKKILKTPRNLRSPKNDLRNVAGVKRLLKTPKQNKSPKNDLSDISGVNELFSSPLLHSTKNDFANVSEVQQLISESNNSIINVTSVTPDRKSRNSSVVLKSENLFDSLIGKTPIRTYSKRNSSPIKSLIKSEREDSIGNRSRRQAMVDQTNYSMEISKVNFKKNSKTPDVSMLGQSTPAVKRVISDNVISIKELSPILVVSNANTPIKTEKPKKSTTKRIIAVKQSPKARVTRRNKNAMEDLNPTEDKPVPSQVPDAIVPKRNTRTRKNAADVKVAVKKTAKAAKSQLNVSETKEKLDEVLKKKVTFASDVKTKSNENSLDDVKYSFIQTDDADKKPAQRARRGTTVASSKASLSVEKVNKPARATRAKSAVTKDASETAEKVTKKSTRSKTEAKSSPKGKKAKPVKETVAKTSKAGVKAEKKGTKAQKAAVDNVEAPAPRGAKRAATNTVVAANKKKAKLDEKPAVPAKASPVKSATKTKKAKAQSSPLVIRKTRSTATRKK